VPFIACGDLSGYDADMNYALDPASAKANGNGDGNGILPPAQAPIKPAYAAALQIKRQEGAHKQQTKGGGGGSGKGSGKGSSGGKVGSGGEGGIKGQVPVPGGVGGAERKVAGSNATAPHQPSLAYGALLILAGLVQGSLPVFIGGGGAGAAFIYASLKGRLAGSAQLRRRLLAACVLLGLVAANRWRTAASRVPALSALVLVMSAAEGFSMGAKGWLPDEK
jgi:hypothetical protein